MLITQTTYLTRDSIRSQMFLRNSLFPPAHFLFSMSWWMETNVYPGDQPRSIKSIWIPYSLPPILCWKPLAWFHKSLSVRAPLTVPNPSLAHTAGLSWAVPIFLPPTCPQANPPSCSMCSVCAFLSNNKLHQVPGSSAPRIKHIVQGQGRASAKILRARWFSMFAE